MCQYDLTVIYPVEGASTDTVKYIYPEGFYKILRNTPRWSPWIFSETAGLELQIYEIRTLLNVGPFSANLVTFF